MAGAASALVARVEDALGAHDVAFDDRDAILDGVSAAGGLGQVTWDELPFELKAKIEAVEALPRTSWEDPMYVPDDTPDDF